MLPVSDAQFEQGRQHQLRVLRVRAEDAGVYTCQAQNSFGPIQVWDVTLLLEFDTHLRTQSGSKHPDEPVGYQQQPPVYPPPFGPPPPPFGRGFDTPVAHPVDGTVRLAVESVVSLRGEPGVKPAGG